MDPFTIANREYVDSAQLRPGYFLSNTAPETNINDETKVDHNMVITILPHQICIFPMYIYNNMDRAIFANGNLQEYNDSDIRYQFLPIIALYNSTSTIFVCRDLIEDPEILMTLATNSPIEESTQHFTLQSKLFYLKFF